MHGLEQRDVMRRLDVVAENLDEGDGSFDGLFESIARWANCAHVDVETSGDGRILEVAITSDKDGLYGWDYLSDAALETYLAWLAVQ
jgi:hypothetical protein